VGGLNTPNIHTLSTPLLTCQYHSLLPLLPSYILKLVTCFGDFGDYCGLLIRITKLLGDGGIVNVIVIFYVGQIKDNDF
jgi:hypothetical protein